MRVKLDRTVCDGFGTCAVHAPQKFSLDEWGYPSLVGGVDVAPEERDGVMRALLDCPAHAILLLDAATPLPAGGGAAVSRSAGPDSLWERRDVRRATTDDSSAG